MLEEMYDMKLNDTIGTHNGEITRVPGGWIYRADCENGNGGYDMTSCFVPWNNEFQPEKKEVEELQVVSKDILDLEDSGLMEISRIKPLLNKMRDILGEH